MGGKGMLMMMRGGPEDNSTGNARRDGVLSKVKDDRHPGADGAGIRQVDRGRRHPRDGGHARQAQADQCGVLRERLDVPRRPEGDRRRRSHRRRSRYSASTARRAAIEQIAKGTNYVGSGQNSPSVIARIGFERMADLLAGKKVEKDTITPVVVITRENAASLLDPNSPF